MDRIGARQQPRHHGVPGLVIGRVAALMLGHHDRTPLGAHDDLVLRALELDHIDQAFVRAGREQGCLVDQVGKVGPGKSGGPARDDVGAHIGGNWHLAHVHQQYLLASADVGQRHHHLAVEAARAQQGGIEHVGPVGRGNHDHARGPFEAVHLDQQLVEGLFALIVAATQAGAALAPDRVDFIDEDDARRVLLGLLEHVAHARSADADEHFDKIRTRNAEERHLGFTGNRPRQQGLAGTRATHHQNTTWYAATQLLEFRGIAQELDQLGHFLLGFIHAGHIGEGHGIGVLVEHARPALAERERTTAAAFIAWD